MKKKSPKSKRFWIVTFSIVAIISMAPFSSYPLSYQPQDNAKVAYTSATQFNAYYEFKIESASVGIIFYPGGLVNPIAYAGFAEALSLETNSSVFVTQPLWNLAITNIQGATAIINSNPMIQSWFLGGHSLGGSSAAFYAIDHINTIQGLFFLASYTTQDADFSSGLLPILTITGSNDQILDIETYQSAQVYTSPITTNVIIEGGNHSQFGDYGFQRGDGEATISLLEQMNQTIFAIETWLSTLVQ